MTPSWLTRLDGLVAAIRRAARLARHVDRYVLYRLFRFDPWHLGHGGDPYARAIVRFLNARPPQLRDRVVEIGCGLGEILRRLRFRSRLGLDRDPRVLQAARILARLRGHRNITFAEFEFPSAELKGDYDAIVMVNWIHQVPPGPLAAALRGYFAAHLNPGGVIVIDTVRDPAYTHTHDVRALTPPGAIVEHVGSFGRGRDIWAFVKPPTPDGDRRIEDRPVYDGRASVGRGREMGGAPGGPPTDAPPAAPAEHPWGT